MVHDSGSFVEGVLSQEDEASERLEARLLRWDAAIRRSAAQRERAEAARQRAVGARERAEAAREHAEVVRSMADQPLHDVGDFHRSEAAESERIAGHREAEADEREHIADAREVEADERERIADAREAQADQRERSANNREAEAEERDDRLSEVNIALGGSDRAAIRREAHLDRRERIVRQAESELDERNRIAEQHELSLEMSRSARELRRVPIEGGSLAGLIERGATLRVLAADLADRMAAEAEEFAAYLENATTRGDRNRRLAISRTEREIARIERLNAAKLRDLDTRFELVEHLPKFPGTGPAPEAPLAGDVPGTGD